MSGDVNAFSVVTGYAGGKVASRLARCDATLCDWDSEAISSPFVGTSFSRIMTLGDVLCVTFLLAPKTSGRINGALLSSVEP
jgi:hypothetical protein